MVQTAFQGFQHFTGRLSSGTLDMMHVAYKEKKKRVRTNGSQWHYSPERWWAYMHLGGVRKERFMIKPHVLRTQYSHPMHKWEKYDIFVMENPSQYLHNLCGYMYAQTWDCSLCHNSAFMDGCLRVWGKRLERDQAIDLMEKWGVRFTISPPQRSYGIDGNFYNKHRLYSHNFPYFADPQTWQSGPLGYGEPDWDWKGRDTFDYSTYGAATKTPRNDFVSFDALWVKAKRDFTADTAATPAAAEPPKQKPAAAAAAKPAETPKPAAAKAAESPANAKPAAATAAEPKVSKKAEKAAAAEKAADKAPETPKA